MKAIRESNVSGFELAYIEADSNFTAPFVTFILKGTFDIVPDGVCTIAARQRPISGDVRHMDGIGRSLAWASDLAPFKPYSDFLVHGTFHQPGGMPAPNGDAWFEFGPLWKRLRIIGPRTVRQAPGRPTVMTAPQPIASLPLRWEYSVGGLRNRQNPMGMGGNVTEEPDGDQVRPMPLIENPRQTASSLSDWPDPFNVGPVPSFFQFRRAKLGTRDQRWAMFRAPLPPEDFDPSYYNAAPPDQQGGNYPRGDEKLTLGNMHPTMPELVTFLPMLGVQLAVLRREADTVRAEAVAMNLDTVVALPDDGQIVLVWRGRCPLPSLTAVDTLIWVAAEAERLEAPKAEPPLPVRLWQAWRAEQDAVLAEQQARREGIAAAESAFKEDQAQTMAMARNALATAGLPDELMRAVQTENDPEVLLDQLGNYVDTVIGDMERALAELQGGTEG